MDVLQVGCFKWHDPNYRWNKLYAHDAKHVNILARSVARNTTIPYEFFCVTDDPTGLDDGIRVIPLWDDHAEMGGCYRRLKMYSSEMAEVIGPRFINLDIDIVVCGNLDAILSRPEPFVAWKDFNFKQQAFCGSVTLMDAGVHAKVWDTFDPRAALKLRHGIGTDQRWAYHVLGRNVPMWDQDDGIYSFWGHLRNKPHRPLPANAAMVVFHGPCGPAMTNLQKLHPWILEHWR